jgi:hypothetical protein
MNDIFRDCDLMNENLAKIDRHEILSLRVSVEHYLWLCGGHKLVAAIRDTAGGEVEGRPTSVINILQRIRALVKIEQESALSPAQRPQHE